MSYYDLAKKYYESCEDLDGHDYDDTKEQDIEEIATALEAMMAGRETK
jgi:hypothetical protein